MGELEFAEGLLDEGSALELVDTTDVCDAEGVGRKILWVELLGVVSVVNEVGIMIKRTYEIHMPWGDGSDGIGRA